jgi:hypothetical protein
LHARCSGSGRVVHPSCVLSGLAAAGGSVRARPKGWSRFLVPYCGLRFAHSTQLQCRVLRLPSGGWASPWSRQGAVFELVSNVCSACLCWHVATRRELCGVAWDACWSWSGACQLSRVGAGLFCAAQAMLVTRVVEESALLLCISYVSVAAMRWHMRPLGSVASDSRGLWRVCNALCWCCPAAERVAQFCRVLLVRWPDVCRRCRLAVLLV